MKRFAALYRQLDQSTATLDKRAALVAYFEQAPPADAAWAIWLLSGGKLRRIANTRELRAWIAQESGLPGWLVDDSYDHVGDLAETLTLLLDDPAAASDPAPLRDWIEERLLPVAAQDEAARHAAVLAGWRSLAFDERLLFNKLLTGALRVGVSQRLVQQALAAMSGIDIARIAQRLLGEWSPTPAALEDLLSREVLASDRQQPYPFFLASPLENAVATLGAIDDWQLEWKWDGIRLQLIRRAGETALWSRGEERLDGRFPEIETAAATLPRDAVIDGELLGWRDDDDAPLPFTALQTRIQRRKPGAKTLADTPARVLAYDLLELDGIDLREQPLAQRRAQLQALLDAHADPRIVLSPLVRAASWDAAAALREDARERGVEGLMLKRASSPYQSGRRRGDWWKWKIEPLTIDAVLLYAQAGHGRRSTLYTDYTFGLWDGAQLVPVAKAYSGLDDSEILALDRWIRAHTTERFGPVRAVTPYHVFELGFEAVNKSSRHKSGIAVRFPRILRWRHDKPFAEADRLATLQALAR
ncbi:ATP-dependent DNA ligase [Xanthomonas translucens pv. undulosa]|uniref:ATP-dependent DNA ligase n=1 Tax=Xanthomonas campestris pv. translucens TaxID=343 RepID=UPI0006421D32|nr:ATP-dependent DNA ligase [Xanthomonas translucens]AKK67049.1 ATP-dependent DNA ligase [Xanthomonas translucens pv. undulosa]MCT8269541.1 ATP-dependent DNA ligase [Xanthomonas translucens pv. undulosa]QSQ41094.1 ATP-dependent DNA ligase [Xanthomonas translucens pv. translucens]QSQ47710.1 ATP-dependent DNA ligase [Xanthomonas translucens pv. undulosa]WLA02103.1 ATP-dependent DNA ligase [Xanthomonas translucens]